LRARARSARPTGRARGAGARLVVGGGVEATRGVEAGGGGLEERAAGVGRGVRRLERHLRRRVRRAV
jgi:hypothetical protein